MAKQTQRDVYRNVAVAAVIILVGLIAAYVLRGGEEPALPQDFLAVYREAALESKQVVSFVTAVSSKIERINDLDLGGRREEALTLIREAGDDNVRAQEEALALSLSLEQLANQLQYITSPKTRRSAIEAIETEIRLANEFVSYAQDIAAFLNALSIAVVTDEPRDREEVARQLEEVNEKSAAINSLNSEFLAKVEELGI